MPSKYVTVDAGLTQSGTRWAVKLRDGHRFTVAIGTFSVTFTDEQRDRFAEAVARAVMPGQAQGGSGAHIVTDPDSHRRHGCPTCLRAEAERRAEHAAAAVPATAGEAG